MDYGALEKMTFSETHVKFQNFPWDVSVLQHIVRSIRTEIRKLAKKQKRKYS